MEDHVYRVIEVVGTSEESISKVYRSCQWQGGDNVA